MKIAIYWEQDDWGGVDSHLLSLLSSWPEANDSFVLFYNKGNPGLERIRTRLDELDNVSLKEITSWSFNEVTARLAKSSLTRWLCKIVYFIQPLFFIYMYLKLAYIFKSHNKYDVLLADNGGYPAAWGCLSAILAAKFVKIPVRVLLVHHEATRPNIFMGVFEYFVDSMVTRALSAIVCPSYATSITITERRNINIEIVKIRVIYNETIPDASSSSIGSSAGIREMANGNNYLLLGIVGRIQSYKGHEDIIYAISRLCTEDKLKVKLVIIGSGDANEISRLKRIATRLNVSEQVIFLGYLEGSSISLIRQLDLVVVATRSFEGFGLTLGEAMVSDVPVLSTNVGAIPEFLDESVGRLVPPCSPKEIALNITDFIRNRGEWEQRALHAKTRIHEVSCNMATEYRKLFIECNDSI